MPTARSAGARLRDLDVAAIDALVAGTFPAGGPPPLVFAELRRRPSDAAGAVRSLEA